MEFLKRLFGLGSSRRATPASTRAVTAVALPPKKGDSSQMYFDAMGRFHQAFAQRDYAKAARLARENMAVIPAWIAATKKELGEFVIGSIPALHDGGRALALIGDDAGLLEMQRLIEQNAALKDWAELIPALQNERRLFVAIVEAVKASPGLMLVELKARVNETDGVRLSSLVRFLEKAGRVVRVKDSRGFKIFPPGAVEIPPEPPKRAVASHRVDRSRPRLHEINITQLDYVPLPRAPLKWEEAHSGRVPERPAEPTEPFEVRDAPWRIEKVEKIPSGERPNTAFRVNRFCGSGLFVIDDLGKSETVGGAPSAAIHYDRTGSQTARRGLLHDIYRHGVHPLGRHLIAMSKARVLHAYDDNLNPMLETDLTLAPEISAIRTRFDIADAELKNHIRCVAMSRDASRYLFTTVDEAWCISEDGQGLWGAKHPVKDGWTQFATPSAVSGTSADVAEALSVMELTLPVTPDEVKARYRALAKRWHPDLNCGDPTAAEKFRTLVAASEILTGIDAASMPQYARATFMKELSRFTVKVGGRDVTLTASFVVGEKFAADWIYAAAFAGVSNCAYLAGYSGRVIMVDANGIGLRVYDIGTVPERIVDTGRYLYLLTQTRLYVVRENALHALVDTYEGDDLVVAQNGFGLLEKKRFRWYEPEGTYLGSVVTKDPIRRVYSSGRSMIVETRQLRASVSGVPEWWA